MYNKIVIFGRRLFIARIYTSMKLDRWTAEKRIVKVWHVFNLEVNSYWFSFFTQLKICIKAIKCEIYNNNTQYTINSMIFCRNFYSKQW